MAIREQPGSKGPGSSTTYTVKKGTSDTRKRTRRKRKKSSRAVAVDPYGLTIKAR